MVLNWKEIDLLISELELENSLIQRIVQPDFFSLYLELYKPGKPRKLYISLKQGEAVFYYDENRKRNKVKLQRFAQLLRSRITGGKITQCGQTGSERIVKIAVSKSGETLYFYLVLRGNTTNAILCDCNNCIIDAFYRRPGQRIASGSTYPPETLQTDPEKANENARKFEVREYPANASFSDYLRNNVFARSSELALDRLKTQADKIFESRRSSLQSRLEKINAQFEKAVDFISYKQQADILLANQNDVKPGAGKTVLDNFYTGGSITIRLDPELSVPENAENLYKKYHKAKASIEHIEKDRGQAEADLEALEKQYDAILQSETADSFEHFIRKNRQTSAAKPEKLLPGLQSGSQGYVFLIGRNARENDALLRKHVRGNDYWLHARDFPGGYIFIKSRSGKSIPLPVFLDAAQLAVHFSKGKGSKNANVFCTQVKYLRRAKHGILGTVIPTQEKNLTVSYDAEKINKLLEQQASV